MDAARMAKMAIPAVHGLLVSVEDFGWLVWTRDMIHQEMQHKKSGFNKGAVAGAISEQ